VTDSALDQYPLFTGEDAAGYRRRGKKAEKYFTSTFVVMSGDGLTDIDLTRVLAFHKKKKSLATMVLKKVDARLIMA